jgi:hypothetical protein
MEEKDSTRPCTWPRTDTERQSGHTPQGPIATINEQVLIGAFDKHCKGLIPFGEVFKMCKRPSRYDKALLFLLDSFFASSVFAFAQCALFGVDAQSLSFLRGYLKDKFTKKEKQLLRKWIE